MRAVVLAAGVGSRLGDLTARRPKCMIEVAGAPVLERNLQWLAASGVTDVAVNLHHLPEIVRGHFGDGSELGVRIRWSYEPELLGTAGTVASLREWLAGASYLVVYGDNLFHVDLAAFVAAHRRGGAAATVAVFERQDVSASGVAELDDLGRVRRFVEKPAPGDTDSRLVSGGLLLLEGETLAAMPERGDLGRDVMPALAARGALQAYVLGPTESVRWIDTPADLERTVALVGGVA